jgi:chromosome segregation ATPase
MIKLFLALFILSNLAPQRGLSNTPQPNPDFENPKLSPEILSQSGKNRIKDHLQIIDRNITNTENNIQATKKNIGVIESEIQELDSLKKEHLTLKSRYLEFLANANQENIKNNKAIAEIEDFEKRVKGLTKETTTSGQLTELETAKSEKQQREDWKKETQQKIARIGELLVGVEKNLQSIEGRKAPLIEQLKTWGNRHKEYETLLTKLSQKKKDAEKFLTASETGPSNKN